MSKELSMITGMFEEIKKTLDLIKKSGNKENISTEPSVQQINTANIEALIRNIKQPDLSSLQQELEEQSELVKLSDKNIWEELKKINERSSEKQIVEHSPQRHFHTIDLKSSKVVIAIITLSFFLIASCACNVLQLQTNNQLSDNDLKYRFIKAKGGADTVQIYELENLFQYNRNNNKIKELKQNVEQYELKIKKIAEDMERARLKEEKAEKLKKEANKLKGGN